MLVGKDEKWRREKDGRKRISRRGGRKRKWKIVDERLKRREKEEKTRAEEDL